MTSLAQSPPAELAFPFLRANDARHSPRTRRVTEVRGPYYSVRGPGHLTDALETMGEHVDALKFAGGSFPLMPEPALRQIIEIAHEHDVLVSTGGFIEHVLTQGRRCRRGLHRPGDARRVCHPRGLRRLHQPPDRISPATA
jgi:hypothetical protein